jgi:hypothetical protein
MKRPICHTSILPAIFCSLLVGANAEEPKTNEPTQLQKEVEASRNSPWWGGWKAHIIEPSIRMYFDIGSDDANEVDIYNDGSLVPTINFLELYRPIYVDKFLLDSTKEFSFGPTIGFGITAPAGDSPDGSEQADDAPVLLLSSGVLASVAITDKVSVGAEVGWGWGFSADEGLTDISDSAIYVGLARISHRAIRMHEKLPISNRNICGFPDDLREGGLK